MLDGRVVDGPIGWRFCLRVSFACPNRFNIRHDGCSPCRIVHATNLCRRQPSAAAAEPSAVIQSCRLLLRDWGILSDGARADRPDAPPPGPPRPIGRSLSSLAACCRRRGLVYELRGDLVGGGSGGRCEGPHLSIYGTLCALYYSTYSINNPGPLGSKTRLPGCVCFQCVCVIKI